ncbi:MAG: rod shape-determining protein, partial [Clostridiales bacterium]
GGTTQIAVLSQGGIVCRKSLPIGGDKFDDAIVRYIRRNHNLLIGERCAEDLKINVATAYPLGLTENRIMEVRGRDLLTGLPKSVTFSSLESADAVAEPVEAVLTAVREVLEVTPPELSADIIDKGIVMTGGGAMLNGLDQLIAHEVGVPVYIADDPVSCVARGTGKALSQLHSLSSPEGFSRKAL